MIFFSTLAVKSTDKTLLLFLVRLKPFILRVCSRIVFNYYKLIGWLASSPLLTLIFYSAACLFLSRHYLSIDFFKSIFALFPKFDPDPPNYSCFFNFAKFRASEYSFWVCFNLSCYCLIFYYFLIFIRSLGETPVSVMLYPKVSDFIDLLFRVSLFVVFSKFDFIVFIVSSFSLLPPIFYYYFCNVPYPFLAASNFVLFFNGIFMQMLSMLSLCSNINFFM